MNSWNALAGLVILCLSVGPFVETSCADPYPLPCLQMYPDDIQTELEGLRSLLPDLLPAPGEIADVVEYVISIGQQWFPGERISVAFDGGNYELRTIIEQAAREWEKHAHFTFDFGHNPVTQSFREWSDSDTVMAADIRISFRYAGYWSLVGTDSAKVSPNVPSMNFGGFNYELPSHWKQTVLHEFGHALGLEHEHQHPYEGCDDEFRWDDDPGYIPTLRDGYFVEDCDGRRPGIITVLGGKPNYWKPEKVNHNLRQLISSESEVVSGTFDRESIMLYHFDPWIFTQGAASRCCIPIANKDLSAKDKEGIAKVYPYTVHGLGALVEKRNDLTKTIGAMKELNSDEIETLQSIVEEWGRFGVKEE